MPSPHPSAASSVESLANLPAQHWADATAKLSVLAIRLLRLTAPECD